MVTGEFSRFEHSVVGILYMVFGIVGVISNLMVILTFLREKALLKSSRAWLHISLALSNIGVVGPSPFPASSAFSGKWLYGETGCQLYAFEGMMMGIAAIGNVIALCVERYLVSTRKEAMETNPSGFYWLSIAAVWLNAFFWAIMPVLGWSKYVHEPTGSSCAINWRDADEGYPSYMIMLCIFSFGLPLFMALSSLWATGDSSTNIQVSSASASSSQVDAFTGFREDQLKWLCYSHLLFTVIGWGPFAFLCLWALFSAPVQVSMIAACIPPLACKSMVLMYPFSYIVANERFRNSFFSIFSLASSTAPKKD
ncbi:visual pigment-like receptor peropsin [Haliotis asinina]|uniref:visual pigment-like receptor peropsin n=1 Tax=Haliotis asinina TaxID=109174 RepID=UPI0035324EEF